MKWTNKTERKNVRWTFRPLDRDWSRDGNFVARFAFEFGKDDELSPQTITGSGDFSMDLSYDAHLVQGISEAGAWSFGLGGTIGGSTDRAARTVHQNIFLGTFFTMSRSLSFAGKQRLALLRFGLGTASVDGVDYDPDDVDDEGDPVPSTIVFDPEGAFPRYSRKHGPAMQAEILFPTDGETGTLSIGARFHGDIEPTPWSFHIGYNFDVFGALGKMLGANPDAGEKPVP
jgi:hypothetical protein